MSGTIKGKVRITGKLPGNPIIRMGMDPMCSKANAGKRVIQEYVVAAIDGSLANVFVRVKGNFPQTPPPAQPVVIDQTQLRLFSQSGRRACRSDSPDQEQRQFLHNVDASPARATDSILRQPRAGLVYEFKPKAEEVMMHVKCDVHSWMNLYIGIVTNPYFAVSDTMGGFEIVGFRPERTAIEGWHEKLGLVSKMVTVKAGAVTTVDFSYVSPETAGDDKSTVQRGRSSSNKVRTKKSAHNAQLWRACVHKCRCIHSPVGKNSPSMQLAENMSRIGTESAFEVLVRARALEKAGKNIIHLEIGEPDFPTPRTSSRPANAHWTKDGRSTDLRPASGIS